MEASAKPCGTCTSTTTTTSKEHASQQKSSGESTSVKSAEKLIDAIGRESLNLPDLQTREWYKPSILQFHVVTDKDCSHTKSTGRSTSSSRARTTVIFGDLKRMLYVNKNLDPSCLDDIQSRV